MSGYAALLARELRWALRSGGGSTQALVFYFILVLLIPLGVGPNPDILRLIAPGVLWIGALLACLLSLDRMLLSDAEDGTLEILILSPLPLSGIVAVKSVAHWLTTGLPLTILAPVLGLTFNLSGEVMFWLVVSLACGTPALSFIGAFGGAVTMGLKRGGLLLSILVLPLYIPTLIFGTLTTVAALEGRESSTSFALLTGTTLFALVLGPPIAARIVRIQLR